MNAALTTGQKEQVAFIVPTDLVHLKLELFIFPCFERLAVNERYQIFFVADCDGPAIW